MILIQRTRLAPKHLSMSYRKHKFAQMSRGFLVLDKHGNTPCFVVPRLKRTTIEFLNQNRAYFQVFKLEIHETGRLSYIISETTRLKTISI